MWKIFFLVAFFSISFMSAQQIELYSQFSGRYDYTAIGNTMNLVENGGSSPCDISTSSEASLELEENQQIVAAYLYWSGSGPGDFNIDLNGTPITAERTFTTYNDDDLEFFAAFADVTEQVTSTGNTTYMVSDLDVTEVIPPNSPYCSGGVNYAGWAIAIIYEDENLPLNQLNVYDGLQSVPEEINILLENLNVLDNEGAKIGFIAWEGDAALADNESLRINGNLIGNPPLNPSNNAFNGTNSFTGQTDLFNMDIDFYYIQNNIQIGDTSVDIQLTSDQDFVMVNNIITVLNSQVADASVTIDFFETYCYDRDLFLEFTVYNNNSTEVLPAGTEVALIANGVLLTMLNLPDDIEINESWQGNILLGIDQSLGTDINLEIHIDPNNDVLEINENNNSASIFFQFKNLEDLTQLPELLTCNKGNKSAVFDLSQQIAFIPDGDFTEFSFFTSLEDATNEQNEILTTDLYQSEETPQFIYVRSETVDCYEIFGFFLKTKNCPPFVPEGFSPNGDGINDTFHISELYDIFTDFEISIFSRLGNKVYIGDNSIPEWDGTSNTGINSSGNLPTGTYYYVLNLNDPGYDIITGWVYLNR